MRRVRRSGFSQRAKDAYGNGLPLRDVELRLDPSGCRQLEANCRRIAEPLNFVGANIMRSQFAGIQLKGQVPGGEPNLLSGLVLGSRGTT